MSKSQVAKQLITIQAENTDAAANEAEALLLAHAKAVGFEFKEKPLSLTAAFSDDPGSPIGYLEGTSMQGRFYLSRLAIRSDARALGVGSELLSDAERIASERGDVEVVLDTWSFQAEEFYSAQGYEVIARLDDVPNGAGKVWMHKKLVAPSL